MKRVFYLLLILIIFTGCAVNRNISNKPNFVAENYFLFGQTAMQQHDFESAIQLYQKAVEADSNNIYLKETLLEALTLTSYFDESANAKIIEIGENYCENSINSEMIYSLMAEAYRKEQQYEIAEICFKKAIKEQTTMRNLTAFYVFQQNTNPPGNIKLLKKALKYSWDEKKLVLTIAELYSKIDSVRSLEIFTETYKKWSDEECLTPLLTAYEKLGLYDKVLETIQFHIDNKRELSAPIKIYLIGRYFALEKYDEVLKNSSICFEVGTHDILKYLFFSAINKNDFKTGTLAGLAIEKSGELEEGFAASFYTYFAELYLATNNYEKAVESLLKADNIEVIYSYIFSDELFNSTDQKEKIYKLLMEYHNSLEDKANANYLLGIFHTEFKEKKNATTYLNKLSLEYINKNKLNLMMAIAYIQNTMDLTKAKTLLEDLDGIVLTPNELIASLLFGTEHDSIAYSMLKEEISVNPKPDPSTFATCSILGELYDTTENLFIILEKGIALYPENAELLNATGYLIAKNKFEEKYDSAELYLKKAVSLMPESEMIWDSLAWLYFRQEKYDEALEAMEIPLSKEINNSEIAYHLGIIYSCLNKKKKAKYYYNLAIELDNEKQSVQLSKKKLSEN